MVRRQHTYSLPHTHTHLCRLLHSTLLLRVSVHLLQRRVLHRPMAALRSALSVLSSLSPCRHLVRAGADVLPQLHQLNATIDYLLAKQVRCYIGFCSRSAWPVFTAQWPPQGESGALLPNGTTGEIRRSARAASLLQVRSDRRTRSTWPDAHARQWWHSAVDPRDDRVANALGSICFGCDHPSPDIACMHVL